MSELTAIFTIAFRDLTKLFRDRLRILASFIFPFIFIGILGVSLQSNLQQGLAYDFLTFIFLGVLAQTLFQSTAAGIISLIEDRQNDFAQELFIAPISRYSIIIGKILGESMVASIQVVGIVVFGLVMGIHFDLLRLAALLPFALLVCLFGGAFGVLVMSNISDQRSINQIFPFLIFPQFFLAGVFSPVKILPLPILILSRISPMTYAVDLLRSIYYSDTTAYNEVVLFSPALNLVVVIAVTVIFLSAGTYLFVKNERNK